MYTLENIGVGHSHGIQNLHDKNICSVTLNLLYRNLHRFLDDSLNVHPYKI